MTTTAPTITNIAPSAAQFAKLFHGRPSTSHQREFITRLEQKALRNPEDYEHFSDTLALRFGFTTTVTYDDGRTFTYADQDGAARATQNIDREVITSVEARIHIGILKAMAAEPRCGGYCGQRGVEHSKVRYYDDHYDYECGLS